MRSEKSAICREWARVGGAQDEVFVAIDERSLAEGVVAPEDEDEMVVSFGERPDRRIGKSFPSLPGM